MRTQTKFYMGSPLRKRDMSNMCSKMPHVHVYCSGDARRLTGGLGLHILSVCVGACCVRARARTSGQTVSRLSSGLTSGGGHENYFPDLAVWAYSCVFLSVVNQADIRISRTKPREQRAF